MAAWLALNLSVSYAYDAIAVNGSYPTVLPYPAQSQAVGYDESTNSILIFGGNIKRLGVIFSIDEEKFDNLGEDYMSVGTSGNSYYTMIDNYLWTINAGGNGFITIDTKTREEHIPSTEFPVNISPHACLASYNTYLFVVGGWNDSKMQHIIQIYDINNDIWITDAPLMQESRSQCGCIVNNAKLYVVAGLQSDTIEYLDVSGDLFNITSETWKYINEHLQTTLRGLTVVNYEDTILILGGRSDDNNDPIYSTTIPVIDVSTNTISIAGSLAYGEVLAGCIIVNERVYIFGGSTSDGDISSYQYIDVSNHTTTTTQIPQDECVWTIGENTLNLTQIQGFILNKISDNDPQQIYSLSPCSNNINCNGESSMITINTIYDCIETIAKWDEGVTQPKYSNNYGGEWEFVYINGDGCSDGPETVVSVFWNCNQFAGSATIKAAKEIGICNFEIQIDSNLACN